jgi:copper chaperone
MKEFKLKVPDISCGHCVAAVRAALEGVEGVEGIEVSLDAKAVHVRGIDELDISDILGAIRAAGYSPEIAG